jgi:hypothetical protein
VLLNVALIWATAFATLRRIFLRTALLTPALPLNSCDRLPRTSHHNVSGQLPDSAHTPTQLTSLGNSHPWATHTPGQLTPLGNSHPNVSNSNWALLQPTRPRVPQLWNLARPNLD